MASFQIRMCALLFEDGDPSFEVALPVFRSWPDAFDGSLAGADANLLIAICVMRMKYACEMLRAFLHRETKSSRSQRKIKTGSMRAVITLRG